MLATWVKTLYWARGKFGEQERGVRVARGAVESNFSLLSALQTSQVFNISTYARLKYELIVNLSVSSTRSLQQFIQNFIIVGRAQSSTRQCLRDYIFFLSLAYIFILKLRESVLLNDCKIHIKALENYKFT